MLCAVRGAIAVAAARELVTGMSGLMITRVCVPKPVLAAGSVLFNIHDPETLCCFTAHRTSYPSK